MKKDFDFLNEMQVRFANTRLREFINIACLPEPCTPNLDEDKRMGFVDYIVRKELGLCHETWVRLQNALKSANVPSETFGVHYDTLVLHMMTWLDFSMAIRHIRDFGSFESKALEGSSDLSSCLSLSTSLSQLMMAELMGSGHESEEFIKIDSLIEAKVSKAYTDNQARLTQALSSKEEPQKTFVIILMNALKEFTADSLQFALERWQLSLKERKLLVDKSKFAISEDDHKKISCAMVKTMTETGPAIDELFSDLGSVHERIFK